MPALLFKTKTMLRQARRKELRELEKEYKRILDNKQFQKVLKSKDFDKLCKEELDLLKDRKHSNSQLQNQFDFGCILIARIKEIESRIAKLTTLAVDKKDIMGV